LNNPSGNLLHNLIFFGHWLRALGVDTQPDGISNLVKATSWIPIDQKQDFRHAARSLLIRRRQDLEPFERAFDQFWQARKAQRPEMGSGVDTQTTIEYDPFAPEALGAEMVGAAPRIRYSPAEALRYKDFTELSPEELDAVKPLLAELKWKLGQRHTRRWQRGSGDVIDMRLMLRQSLRHGGEPLQVLRRKHRLKPRRLVVIADISGSMERYSSLLLHFIFGLSQSLDLRTEVFVFSTRLTRITRQVHGHDVEHALAAVAQQVPDWSGGTRIGQALKTFNFVWTRRVLARGAVVLLVSDGWDRGDAGLLRIEMARLQRSSYRLIWLNPLLGSPEYEPLTRGMKAALPFVDDFLPIHNLSSVEELARRLESLEDRRPVRKQQPALRYASQ
jgi:uncharacterized protein